MTDVVKILPNGLSTFHATAIRVENGPGHTVRAWLNVHWNADIEVEVQARLVPFLRTHLGKPLTVMVQATLGKPNTNLRLVEAKLRPTP